MKSILIGLGILILLLTSIVYARCINPYIVSRSYVSVESQLVELYSIAECLEERIIGLERTIESME